MRFGALFVWLLIAFTLPIGTLPFFVASSESDTKSKHKKGQKEIFTYYARDTDVLDNPDLNLSHLSRIIAGDPVMDLPESPTVEAITNFRAVAEDTFQIPVGGNGEGFIVLFPNALSDIFGWFYAVDSAGEFQPGVALKWSVSMLQHFDYARLKYFYMSFKAATVSVTNAALSGVITGVQPPTPLSELTAAGATTPEEVYSFKNATRFTQDPQSILSAVNTFKGIAYQCWGSAKRNFRRLNDTNDENPCVTGGDMSSSTSPELHCGYGTFSSPGPVADSWTVFDFPFHKNIDIVNRASFNLNARLAGNYVNASGTGEYSIKLYAYFNDPAGLVSTRLVHEKSVNFSGALSGVPFDSRGPVVFAYPFINADDGSPPIISIGFRLEFTKVQGSSVEFSDISFGLDGDVIQNNGAVPGLGRAPVLFLISALDESQKIVMSGHANFEVIPSNETSQFVSVHRRQYNPHRAQKYQSIITNPEMYLLKNFFTLDEMMDRGTAARIATAMVKIHHIKLNNNAMRLLSKLPEVLGKPDSMPEASMKSFLHHLGRGLKRGWKHAEGDLKPIVHKTLKELKSIGHEEAHNLLREIVAMPLAASGSVLASDRDVYVGPRVRYNSPYACDSEIRGWQSIGKSEKDRTPSLNPVFENMKRRDCDTASSDGIFFPVIYADEDGNLSRDEKGQAAMAMAIVPSTQGQFRTKTLHVQNNSDWRNTFPQSKTKIDDRHPFCVMKVDTIIDGVAYGNFVTHVSGRSAELALHLFNLWNGTMKPGNFKCNCMFSGGVNGDQILPLPISSAVIKNTVASSNGMFLYAHTIHLSANLQSVINVSSIASMRKDLGNRLKKGYNALSMGDSEIMAEVVDMHMGHIPVTQIKDAWSLQQLKAQALTDIYSAASKPPMKSLVSIVSSPSKRSNYYFENGKSFYSQQSASTQFDVTWLNRIGFRIPLVSFGNTVISYQFYPKTEGLSMDMDSYMNVYVPSIRSNPQVLNECEKRFVYEHPRGSPVEITDMCLPMLNADEKATYWAADAEISGQRPKFAKARPKPKAKPKTQEVKDPKNHKKEEEQKTVCETPQKPQLTEAEKLNRDPNYNKRKAIVTKDAYFTSKPLNNESNNFMFEHEVSVWRFFSTKMQNTKVPIEGQGMAQIKKYCIPLFRAAYYESTLNNLLKDAISLEKASYIQFANSILNELGRADGPMNSKIAFAVAKISSQIFIKFLEFYSGIDVTEPVLDASVNPTSSRDELAGHLYTINSPSSSF